MTDWRYATDLWEYQVGPLTAGALHLGTPDYADVPVLIAIYDGDGAESLYIPAEIGYIGAGDRPDAVVITAIPPRVRIRLTATHGRIGEARRVA